MQDASDRAPPLERARGCTGLVKVICRENKEQKEKRKYHAGTSGSNDAIEAMEETDSTEVKYKIRQWSLPGATIVRCSMLAVGSSGLNWMTKLSWKSCGVLQEGILCDVLEMFCGMAGRSRRKAYSWNHCEAPHTRYPTKTPGHQGTHGGGMSDAPENSKTQTQFHQEVKCHTKRSFYPTNQAKCRVCYDLSSCWLFPLP